MASRVCCPLGVWARWLVLVLELVVGLLPLQTSGVLHVVADVVTMLADEQLHQGEPPCSCEERGERCPPDCPHCHCLSSLPLLPAGWPLPMPPRARLLRTVTLTYDATAPPRPLLSGLERPPRLARLA